MSYIKQLEELSALVRKFDAGLLKSDNTEVLPLSFFSQSYDLLKEMMSRLHEMEENQVLKMKKQLDIHEVMISEWVPDKMSQIVSTPKVETVSEEAPVVEAPVIEVPVAEETKPALKPFKIALNDRFLFQRTLFSGNGNEMDDVLHALSTLSSVAEATAYLDSRFAWNWDDESPSLFKALLEKTYA